MPTASSTLGIITFLALDPIRCMLEHPDEIRDNCERTLIGQTGLVMIILCFYGFSLADSVFPARAKRKVAISLHEVALGNITTRKRSKIVLLMIVVFCCFFLFSQYNSRGTADEFEEDLLVTIGNVGTFFLFIIRAYEWREMAAEIGENNDGQEREEEAPQVVLKLDRAFQVIGVWGALYYTCMTAAECITQDARFYLVQIGGLPFIIIMAVLVIFSDPRGEKKTFEKSIPALLAISEVIRAISFVRQERYYMIIQNIGGIIVLFKFFKYIMKMTDKIAAKDDVGLSTFLLDTLVRNIIRESTGMFFVTFKALNCV